MQSSAFPSPSRVLVASLRGLACAALALGLSLWAVAAAPMVTAGQRTLAGVDRGELLLGELNCIACHGGGEGLRGRVASKQAPALGEAGARLTPQFLKAFLSNPHAEKPGTTMPDVLASLPAREKAEVVDGLVHYLASLGAADTGPAIAAEPFKVEQGKRLYHSVGCVTCHEPFEPPTGASAIPAGLRETSVPLGNLAHKTTVRELVKFLIDPLKTRPSGRMPAMNLSEPEATAIAIYLLREQAPGLADPAQMERLAGLRFHYFETTRQPTQPAGDAGIIAEFADSYPGHLSADARDRIRHASSGVTDKFGLGEREREDFYAFLFDGYLSVPADGEYTFYTLSDDGSRLYLNGELVVNNDGEHGETEKSGKITLTRGDHAIRVTFFENAGGEALRVSWQGPGFRKQEIPGGVLAHMGQAMKPTGAIEFAVDVTKAARGRAHFQQQGCANCHGIPDNGPAMLAAFRLKNFAELNSPEGGCLADQPRGAAVNYHLSAEQRATLRQTVANRSALEQPPPIELGIKHTLARLDCYACHYRDAEGGPVEARRGYFTMVGAADLGDEGRLPPHLTRVGAKLNAAWLQELLSKGTKVRPYMATRMPVFGEANVGHLVTAFPKADGGDEPDRPVLASIEDAKFGRKLVGSAGLSCIACHDFGEFKSLGIPALNLTEMTRRLRKEWFHQYMVNPFALRSGTRMPSFWPDGQAVNNEVFDGHTDRQIDAIWAFLSRGALAAPPDGLIQGQWEIVAENEPVIYRHFIEGAGTRAIGVGYPEQANLAWDANEMRLALIWHGPFIDAAMHRQGRGQGFAGPLGHNVVKFAGGPSLALLDETNAPWPAETGRTAGFRMQGYQLDDQMRPGFRYEFQGVQVVDQPVPVPGVIDATFKRTLTFTSEQPPGNLWFRAATGADIIPTASGEWTVDGRMRIKLPVTPGTARVRKAGGQAELLVPVKFTNGQAELVQEIIW
jgi:mono/diheme cytochrome c family protein